MLFSKVFWLGDNGALVRAVRTAAQTAIAMLGVSQFSLWTVDWWNVLGVSGASALLCVLMSIDRFEALMTKPPVGQSDSQPMPVPVAEPIQFVGCGDSR